MKGFNIDVRFEGNEFYPSKLQSKITVPLTIVSEYGTIASRGRYAGKPAPYGMAVFQFQTTEKDINASLKECYLKLSAWKQYLDEYGVEETIVDIGSYEDYPLDVTFSKELVNALSSLNATVEFHTISKERRLDHSKKVLRDLLSHFKKDGDYDAIYSNLINHNLIYDDIAVSTLLYFYFSGNTSKSFEDSVTAIEALTNHLRERA